MANFSKQAGSPQSEPLLEGGLGMAGDLVIFSSPPPPHLPEGGVGLLEGEGARFGLVNFGWGGATGRGTSRIFVGQAQIRKPILEGGHFFFPTAGAGI